MNRGLIEDDGELDQESEAAATNVVKLHRPHDPQP